MMVDGRADGVAPGVVVRVVRACAVSSGHRRSTAALTARHTRRVRAVFAAWSVDQLGRSLTDLLGVLQELHARGVDL